MTDTGNDLTYKSKCVECYLNSCRDVKYSGLILCENGILLARSMCLYCIWFLCEQMVFIVFYFTDAKPGKVSWTCLHTDGRWHAGLRSESYWMYCNLCALMFWVHPGTIWGPAIIYSSATVYCQHAFKGQCNITTRAPGALQKRSSTLFKTSSRNLVIIKSSTSCLSVSSHRFVPPPHSNARFDLSRHHFLYAFSRASVSVCVSFH